MHVIWFFWLITRWRKLDRMNYWPLFNVFMVVNMTRDILILLSLYSIKMINYHVHILTLSLECQMPNADDRFISGAAGEQGGHVPRTPPLGGFQIYLKGKKFGPTICGHCVLYFAERWFQKRKRYLSFRCWVQNGYTGH